MNILYCMNIPMNVELIECPIRRVSYVKTVVYRRY